MDLIDNRMIFSHRGWGQESIVGANVRWPIDLNIANEEADGSLKWNYFDEEDVPDQGLVFFRCAHSVTPKTSRHQANDCKA
jgi:hypothetical protein